MLKNIKKWSDQKIVAFFFLLFLLLPGIFSLTTCCCIGIRFLTCYYQTTTKDFITFATMRGHNEGRIQHFDPILKRDILRLQGYGGIKFAFIDYFGLVQRLMNKNYIPDVTPDNDVFRLNNGHLTFILNEIDQKKIEQIGTGLVTLNQTLKEQNIPFLYIQAPYKICKDSPQLPIGVHDYFNEYADMLLEYLKQHHIQTFDFREQIKQENLNHYDLFFKTDHHWTPQTGFWAFTKISQYLNERFDYETDPLLLDIKNYNQIDLKESCLGSYGRRVGAFYVKPDNFTFINPRFDTDLSVSKLVSANGEKTKRGKIEDVLLCKEYYGKLSYTLSNYNFYGGNSSLYITNHRAKNNITVAIIRDSFSAVVTPYLALNYKHLIIIDERRWYIGHKFNLYQCLKENKPDIVIVMITPNILLYNLQETVFSPPKK